MSTSIYASSLHRANLMGRIYVKAKPDGYITYQVTLLLHIIVGLMPSGTDFHLIIV